MVDRPPPHMHTHMYESIAMFLQLNRNQPISPPKPGPTLILGVISESPVVSGVFPKGGGGYKKFISYFHFSFSFFYFKQKLLWDKKNA